MRIKAEKYGYLFWMLSIYFINLTERVIKGESLIKRRHVRSVARFNMFLMFKTLLIAMKWNEIRSVISLSSMGLYKRRESNVAQTRLFVRSTRPTELSQHGLREDDHHPLDEFGSYMTYIDYRCKKLFPRLRAIYA